MFDLSNPAVIRGIISRHGLRPSKSIGQNFITDPQICPKIAELGGAGHGVAAIEIGPGLGVLTKELAARCDKVVAIELDRRLLPVLNETLAGFDNIDMICGDVLKTDLTALIREKFAHLRVIVCANLPYYITSPVIMHLLESRLPVEAITVMVQKEAAARIAAPIPSREMGAVTVAVRWYSEPELLFEVPPESFMPTPGVMSAVIRLNVRKSPPVNVKDEALFFKAVKAAFSQRRKTLLNCLSAGLALDKTKTADILTRAGVPAGARAEQLRLEDFASIADAFSEVYNA
jgi:16S rRNA (adenine1518-N6/adenine1519-N6)-dimethyltransferase